MKIDKLDITSVGGVGSLAVSFDTNMNLLCGPNGVGKTTVLECIAHLFAAGSITLLKRSAQATTGRITASFSGEPMGDKSVSLDIAQFTPQQHDNASGELHKFARYAIVLKTTRTVSYQRLDAVGRDTEKPHTYEEAKAGVSLMDAKNWFVNRYLYSAHPQALNETQLSNFRLATRCFSLLNPAFSFSRVDAATNEILVNTPTGEIYYEYLSSGFRSTLSILFAIIKETEFRFVDPRLLAENFNGIVLIDEIELHLHPEWQSRITHILRSAFPAAQFIATTHSPHVVQAADRNNIIALQFSANGVVNRALPDSPYGFKGWTVEEVLTDVMGLKDTRTELFLSKMRVFTAALDCENKAAATAAYYELDRLLHPKNALRKLLRLQLSALTGPIND